MYFTSFMPYWSIRSHTEIIINHTKPIWPNQNHQDFYHWLQWSQKLYSNSFWYLGLLCSFLFWAFYFYFYFIFLRLCQNMPYKLYIIKWDFFSSCWLTVHYRLLNSFPCVASLHYIKDFIQMEIFSCWNCWTFLRRISRYFICL